MVGPPKPGYDDSMTKRFCLLSLAALATGLAATPAFADGRADWRDYAWQKIEISQCLGDDNVLVCPLYHQKWDWKRNQWVDITIALDLRRGVVNLVQRLTDNDPKDDDHVCVTALVVDAGGRDLVAHHQNWHIKPHDVLEKSFSYSSPSLASAATIQIGSKQCRDGARQDDRVYANVLAGISN